MSRKFFLFTEKQTVTISYLIEEVSEEVAQQVYTGLTEMMEPPVMNEYEINQVDGRIHADVSDVKITTKELSEEEVAATEGDVHFIYESYYKEN